MRYILVSTAAVLLFARCEGVDPVAPATLPDLSIAGALTTVFWDPFGGPTGESLDGRRPPRGGGTWDAELGPARLWRGSARLEDGPTYGELGSQNCDVNPNAPVCFQRSVGQLNLWLDEQLKDNHEVEVTVLDFDTVGESFDIAGAPKETGGRGALWHVGFWRGTGFVSGTMDPILVLLPIKDMVSGADYTITIRDASATRTYTVDIVGRFPGGGGVSSHTEGIFRGELEEDYRVGVIAISAFETQPKDGVRIKDLRVRAERPATASVSH